MLGHNMIYRMTGILAIEAYPSVHDSIRQQLFLVNRQLPS